MNKLCSLFVLWLVVLLPNFSHAENAVSPITLKKAVEESTFSSQDATDAIDAFNTHLLDPVRKLYYRDTDKPAKLGAIWTQAVYWDMIMNAYKRTNDPRYLQLIEDIYQGGYTQYDKYNWDNKEIWFIYDDIMWWVISLARAYELTGKQEYLDFSISGFERIWSGSTVAGDIGSYDPVDGGMFWMFQYPDKPDAGKMSCINYPTVVAAMTLYNATHNADYLNKAKEVYTWARNNLFDLTSGRVADSKHGTGNPHWKMHTYNQATCIGAAMLLYNETKELQYLNDAALAADYTKNTMSKPNGILPFELGEEQGVYHAIFAQYIIRLIEDGNKPEYLPWLRMNINAGWNNRDAERKLTHKQFTTVFPPSVAISCYDASGIPALMQICPPEGDATPVPVSSPVMIKTEAGLKAMAQNLGGHYILSNDIVLTRDWTPVGNDNNPFFGIFDGNGKVIKNLKCRNSGANRVGLFGYAKTAIIKNVGLENVSVIGQNDVGAVAGRVSGTVIDQCYVAGYVEGNDHVGSIAGGADSDGGPSTLMNCYAYTSVKTRATQVGGILGTTKDLTLKNSYFVGLIVSQSSNAGGILSLIDGGINNIVENNVSMACNIKGGNAYRILANDGGRLNVTKLINNYGYDKSKMNGMPISVNNYSVGPNLKHGGSKSLADLKTKSFYESLSWNMESVWKIEADGFPVFQYQELPVDVDMIVELPQTLSLKIGKTYQLKAVSIIPGKTISFKTGDPSKVTVDEGGLVTALNGGDVTITAITATDGFSAGKESTCIVSVPAPLSIEDVSEKMPEVTVSSGNGSIVIAAQCTAAITVFDIMGKEVQTMTLDETSCSAVLKSGIYLIRVKENGGHQYTLKYLHK